MSRVRILVRAHHSKSLTIVRLFVAFGNPVICFAAHLFAPSASFNSLTQKSFFVKSKAVRYYAWSVGPGERPQQPGGSIDVEPNDWLYRDPTRQLNLQIFELKTGGLRGAGNLVYNRCTGAGREGIQ